MLRNGKLKSETGFVMPVEGFQETDALKYKTYTMARIRSCKTYDEYPEQQEKKAEDRYRSGYATMNQTRLL